MLFQQYLEVFISHLSNETPASADFASLGLPEGILQAITKAGFTQPTPIQQQVIPLVLSGVDVIAQAQTGTGKTAAFGLPALSCIDPDVIGALLVLTPTRELAQQVGDELARFGQPLGLHSVIIQGGSSYRRQLDQLQRGAQIVVATPGRLLDLLKSAPASKPLLSPSVVVLDEADEMLDMGFLDDIQEIFKFLPEERQTLFFSATMPPAMQQLAKKILHTPAFVSATGKETANRDIQQLYYVVREDERDMAFLRLMRSEDPTKSIVFCRTKKEADRLLILLHKEGHSAGALHGDLEQDKRNRVTEAFRRGDITILVATDVAARGLNILDVSHVFNFHLPFDAESYLHRIGRTGRAGRKGVAMSLVTQREVQLLRRVAHIHGSAIEQRVLPTRSELQQQSILKTLSVLRQQSAKEEARHILDVLRSESIGEEDVALRLITKLLDQEKIDGPERIGSPLPVPGEKPQRANYGARQDYAPRKKPYAARGGYGRQESSGREGGYGRDSYRDGGRESREGRENRPYPRQEAPRGERSFARPESAPAWKGGERPVRNPVAPAKTYGTFKTSAPRNAYAPRSRDA